MAGHDFEEFDDAADGSGADDRLGGGDAGGEAGGDGGENGRQGPDDAVDDGEGVPVCTGCFQPVDPYSYYCPNCGEASNGLTQYIPFVNIRWKIRLYCKMGQQIWSKEISLAGRMLRLIVCIVFMPLLLVLLPFMRKK